MDSRRLSRVVFWSGMSRFNWGWFRTKWIDKNSFMLLLCGVCANIFLWENDHSHSRFSACCHLGSAERRYLFQTTRYFNTMHWKILCCSREHSIKCFLHNKEVFCQVWKMGAQLQCSCCFIFKRFEMGVIAISDQSCRQSFAPCGQ